MAAKFNREDVTLGALVAGRIPTNSTSTPVPTGLVSRAVDWEVLPSGASGQVLTTNADGSIGWSGIVQRTPVAVTATGGAATLSWSAGSWFVVTLVAGANTITLANIPAATVRQTTVVELIQPSGGATVTWSGPTVSWGGAGAPTLSSTTGYVDVITLMNVTTSQVRAAANLGFTF